jgi:putative nucleotidyltransferase with HDIG domain
MAKKKFIHIYQCKPGYKLAEDVYDDYGIFILSKDTIIDSHVIKRLKSFRIRQLSVYELQKEENGNNDGSHLEQFKKDYRKDLNNMKHLLDDLAAGRKLDYERVEYISKSIYSKVSNTSDIIECMNEVKNIDEYTYTHSINVSVYGLLIARWLGLPESKVQNVVITGILHDIGKTKIPGFILNKPGPLQEQEYNQIKNHSRIGYELSMDIPQITDEIREGILMHHEREDGSGYPLRVKGEKINPYAKIISVADVYDALTSERVYKKRIPPFDTFGEFIRIGYGYFDTKVLMTFLSNISCYYIGSKVKLNNGETGEVVFVQRYSISTPIVSVNGKCIDLSENRQLKIVEML